MLLQAARRCARRFHDVPCTRRLVGRFLLETPDIQNFRVIEVDMVGGIEFAGMVEELSSVPRS